MTRELQHLDVDEAIAKVSAAVKDWSGGTRIGATLKEFNYNWARRVLTQGADVLLMTDGLERDDTAQLQRKCSVCAEAPSRSCGSTRFCALTGLKPGPPAFVP